ncbi:MAG: methyltransferase domain-containing protein [Parachlamydiales bacterium]|jgi:SAM-dependent methyltransferase
MHKLSMFNMSLFVEDFVKKEYSGKATFILDVGSQDVNGTYKEFFIRQNGWYYTGMDVTAGANVNIIVRDIYNWREIQDRTYDIVISGQTLEHIEYPWLTIKEMARVMKPGGLLCIIVPSSGFEHRYPVDCYRYFPDGLRALAKWAELEVLSSYNCWDEVPNLGERNVWKDSVLIARKP